MLRKQRNIYMTVICVFTLYMLLTYIRFPNTYASTHYLFNYDFGIVKRSLVGSILSYFFGNVTYERICIISINMLSLAIIWLLILTYQALKTYTSMLVAIAFFTSNGFAMFIHTIGYFDHIMVLMCLYMCMCPQQKGYLACFLIIAVVGVMIHELFAVFALPLLMIRIFTATNLKCEKQKKCIVRFCTAAMLLILALTALVFLTDHFRLTRPQARQAALISASKADFVQHGTAHQVLSRSLKVHASRNIISHDDWLASTQGVVLNHMNTIIISVFFAVLCALAIRAPNSSHRNNFFRMMCTAGACLSPNVVILIASDHERFFAFSTVVGFIALLTIMRSQSEKEQACTNNKWVCASAIVAISINLTTTPSLFNDREPTPFPFTQHWEYLRDVRNGDEYFPASPMR